jgi:hypothetical protein
VVVESEGPFTCDRCSRSLQGRDRKNPVDGEKHQLTRFARISSVSLGGSAAGAAIGTAMAGLPGMALGAMTGLTISLADGFAGDVLRDGNPRTFSAVLRDEVIRNGDEEFSPSA